MCVCQNVLMGQFRIEEVLSVLINEALYSKSLHSVTAELTWGYKTL